MCVLCHKECAFYCFCKIPHANFLFYYLQIPFPLLPLFRIIFFPAHTLAHFPSRLNVNLFAFWISFIHFIFPFVLKTSYSHSRNVLFILQTVKIQKTARSFKKAQEEKKNFHSFYVNAFRILLKDLRDAWNFTFIILLFAYKLSLSLHCLVVIILVRNFLRWKINSDTIWFGLKRKIWFFFLIPFTFLE